VSFNKINNKIVRNKTQQLLIDETFSGKYHENFSSKLSYWELLIKAD